MGELIQSGQGMLLAFGILTFGFFRQNAVLKALLVKEQRFSGFLERNKCSFSGDDVQARKFHFSVAFAVVIVSQFTIPSALFMRETTCTPGCLIHSH